MSGYLIAGAMIAAFLILVITSVVDLILSARDTKRHD